MPSERPEQYHDAVKQLLEKITHFSKIDFQVFWENLQYVEFDAKDILSEIGVVENRLCFLMEGITRIFSLNNGKEYTLRFNFPGAFFSSYTSFVNQTPSEIAIEALTDGKMFFLTPQGSADVYKRAPGAERIGKAMIELLYKEREEKEISSSTQSADENYKSLICKHPKFIKEIPQKYLASYLGITPESLSRIRRKIWKC